MMSNLEYYKAYLKAVRVSECLLTAYAKEDQASADYYRGDSIDELRKLASHLGFELVSATASEQKDAA